MQAVLAEHAFLTQVSKLGVADRSGRVPVIHHVAPHTVRVGRLDDHVATQIGDLAPARVNGPMIQTQGLVHDDRHGPIHARGADLHDRPFLG